MGEGETDSNCRDWAPQTAAASAANEWPKGLNAGKGVEKGREREAQL